MNNKIQSRREFFKNAAKSVLPILGCMMLPGSIMAHEFVSEEAPQSCNGSCYGLCTTTCTNGCKGQCKGCKGSCENGALVDVHESVQAHVAVVVGKDVLNLVLQNVL